MPAAPSHILVPVDFSPQSEAALQYAAMLAGRVGASLEILHVTEDPFVTGVWGPDIYVPNLPELRAAVQEEAEQRVAALGAALQSPGVRVKTTVKIGPPAPTILEYARSANVDVIVMGTQGRTGLSHLLLGSVAERVVRMAPCPVLTVRSPAPRQKSD